MGNRKLVVGILAHVDAGKTTLAESILYTSGSIRKLGRVDHKNTFLDTDRQERDRGITIFSKQAELSWQGMNITLLDTPGHVDFSAEMERTLQVLDYAVLVVSGADGVQGHVLTLWRLLERYQVPVFLFINKMDQPDTDASALLAEIRDRLDERCVAFGERDAAFYEDIAVCDEELLERYLEAEESGRIESVEEPGEAAKAENAQKPEEAAKAGDAEKLENVTEAEKVEKAEKTAKTGNAERPENTAEAEKVEKPENTAKIRNAEKPGEAVGAKNAELSESVVHVENMNQTLNSTTIDDKTIVNMIAARKIFPCYFGSALKVEGVTELLDGIRDYTKMPSYGEKFGAKVYKIARDVQGNRLTYVKITGGTLRVKQTITTHGGNRIYGGSGKDTDTPREEKVDQIRIYSGDKYSTEQEVGAGTVCALMGPVTTFCGEGLGEEKESTIPLLEPVMTYRIVLPEGCDVHQMYNKLCQLEEEEPQLHIVWKEQISEIQAQLMGEVQIEILRNMISERFGIEVTFDEGSIVYKETIADRVEGVGHYEPLRHYAEVHLILEPGEPGSGLQFGVKCSEDMLGRNWQRLILTHLEEKEHLGVLTGSPITDMQIILVAGRAHLKHTEGGDFRQATYRAVRQGLCKARSILLEPVYAFRLELPTAVIGRGMTDMQGRSGKFGAPEMNGEYAVLTGTVPVSTMAGYQAEVLAYSGGKGRLYTELKGYAPCHNAEDVIGAMGYEAEHDVENPCSSVFCAHGAGFVVEWDQVEDYMHLDRVLSDIEPMWLDSGEADLGSGDDGFEEHGIGYAEQEAGYTGYGSGGHTRLSGRHNRLNGGRGKSTVTDVIGQDEIDEIMNRTYGIKERKKQGWARTIRAEQGAAIYDGSKAAYEINAGEQTEYDKTGSCKLSPAKTYTAQEEYLLVDGYNIIFAWDSLKELAKNNLDSARGKLMDILSNFQGYRKMHLILVFDAYKVKGSLGSTIRYHNIDVVYTREAETADQYIEKVTHQIGRKYRVRVATSDGLEQLIIMGAGAVRVPAGELLEEVMAAGEEMGQMFLQGTDKPAGDRNYLLEGASEEVTAYVHKILDK